MGRLYLERETAATVWDPDGCAACRPYGCAFDCGCRCHVALAVDFGLVRVRPVAIGTPAGSAWAWTLWFRDGRVGHIARRSGRVTVQR